MNRVFRHAVSAACLALLLTACGGGVSAVTAFKPERLLALGDEFSSLTATGLKYSINALAADGVTVDCESNPLWVQAVASVYEFKFSQCLGTATEAKAQTLAAPGNTVAGLKAQIDAQAALGIHSTDLVTVLVGLHDVREVFESRTASTTEAEMTEVLRQRGITLGNQVNRLVNLGAKVIVSTAPDLGITPYGLAKGTADAALLTRLSAAFNGRLRVTILNDGRYVGLVLADELLQSAATVPASYGVSNVLNAACLSTAALPNCTTAASSLVTDANAETWMWADSLHFGVAMQRQLGTVAAARARSNPF